MVKITKKGEHETVTAYYRLAPSYMAVINRFDYVELFTHYECFLFMIIGGQTFHVPVCLFSY